VPFHDINEERGTMVLLDGSHRWSSTAQARFFNDGDLDEVERSLVGPKRTAGRVPLRLKKGQISFHHGWTVHGSYSNRNAQFRLALAVHLQDRDNHYQPCWSADGRPIHMIDEQLCRRLPNGEPDFADPTIFPRI
jgi:ectoine hydroxylase-related dioxygenase (phytanoyl-CoA dioxygenase family)